MSKEYTVHVIQAHTHTHTHACLLPVIISKKHKTIKQREQKQHALYICTPYITHQLSNIQINQLLSAAGTIRISGCHENKLKLEEESELLIHIKQSRTHFKD